MSEERILVFSPVYPEGNPMRYRVIDKQFLKTCTDVESWVALSPEILTRPDSKPYKYETVDDWLLSLEDASHFYDPRKLWTAARERKE